MSQEFYHLQTDPFRSTPDPAFCVPHERYAWALAAMRNALQQGEGFVTVTGLPGTGKTTLLEQFQFELDSEKFCIARLNSTRMQAEDLLHTICRSLALDVDVNDKAKMLHGLRQFLIRQAEAGRCTLLLIDEAQDLPPQALEELRLLGNLQQNVEPVLQVFLVGQQQLLETLQLPEMKPLFQRLGALCHLAPLNLQETCAYIEHRLHRAGWDGDPAFTDRTYRMIHHFSEGFPRQINRLCGRLLRHGSVEKKPVLGCFDTLKVLRDLLGERPGVSREQTFGRCLDILNESWLVPADSKGASRAEADAWARFLEAQSGWVAARRAENRAVEEFQPSRAPKEGSESPDTIEGATDNACGSPLRVSGAPGKQVRDPKGANSVNELAKDARPTTGANELEPEIPRQGSSRIERRAVSSDSSSTASQAIGVRSVLSAGTRVLRAHAARLHSAVQARRSPWQALKSLGPPPDCAALLSSAPGAVVVTLLVSLLFVWGKEASEGQESGPRNGPVVSQAVDAGPPPVVSNMRFTDNVKPSDDSTQRSFPPAVDEPSAPVSVPADQSVDSPTAEGEADVSVGLDDDLVRGSVIQDGEPQPGEGDRESTNPLSASEGEPPDTAVATQSPAQTSDTMDAVSPAPGTAVAAFQSEHHSITQLDDAAEDAERGPESDVTAATESAPAALRTEPALSDEHKPVQLVVAPVPPADPAPSESVIEQQRLNELMARADQAIKDNRLTVPVGNNAFHYYRQVLKMAPGHRGAQAGMQRIAERYARLIEPMLDAERVHKASTYVARGLMVAPHNEELLSLKERVTELKATMDAQAEMAVMEEERASAQSEEPVQEEAPVRLRDQIKSFFRKFAPAERP